MLSYCSSYYSSYYSYYSPRHVLLKLLVVGVVHTIDVWQWLSSDLVRFDMIWHSLLLLLLLPVRLLLLLLPLLLLLSNNNYYYCSQDAGAASKHANLTKCTTRYDSIFMYDSKFV